MYTDPTTKLANLLSGYFYTDYLLQNEVKTGLKQFPFNLILEFQDNLDAAAHPLDTTGKAIPSLGSQGEGYLGEASLLLHFWPLVTLVPMIGYLHWVVIPYEESRLLEAFGTPYEEYRARVGRWIGPW